MDKKLQIAILASKVSKGQSCYKVSNKFDIMLHGMKYCGLKLQFLSALYPGSLSDYPPPHQKKKKTPVVILLNLLGRNYK